MLRWVSPFNMLRTRIFKDRNNLDGNCSILMPFWNVIAISKYGITLDILSPERAYLKFWSHFLQKIKYNRKTRKTNNRLWKSAAIWPGFTNEKLFLKILQLSVTLQRKNQPTATFDRTPPPPGQQLFPKSGKRWWVVSQIWLNSDSNELNQSWVRLVNLGVWVESELSQVSKFGIWVESELSHLDCHMSQSRVSPTKWVEHNPGRYTGCGR